MFQRIICQARELPEMTVQTNLEKSWALGLTCTSHFWKLGMVVVGAWQACTPQTWLGSEWSRGNQWHSTGWRWFWNQKRRSRVPQPKETGRKSTASFWGFAMESGLGAEWKADQENFPSDSALTKKKWTLSTQNGVSGTRFTFPPDTTKNQTKQCFLRSWTSGKEEKWPLMHRKWCSETSACPRILPWESSQATGRGGVGGVSGRAWHILSRRNRAGSLGDRGSQCL